MTPLQSLPDDVRQLLATIDSYEKLAIVCLAAGRRDVTWSPPSIASELTLPLETVQEAVRELMAAGLLERVGGGVIRYAAPSDKIDGAVRALERLYQQDTLLVVRAITQFAMARIRSSAARTFADAFVVTHPKPKEPNDG